MVENDLSCRLEGDLELLSPGFRGFSSFNVFGLKASCLREFGLMFLSEGDGLLVGGFEFGERVCFGLGELIGE
jgi:hypothetical protein